MAGRFTVNKPQLVGVKSIDTEHEYIYNLINSLLESDKFVEKSLEKKVATLIDAIHIHFVHEEVIARRLGYSYLLSHRNDHLVTLGRLSDIRNKIKRGCLTDVDLYDSVSPWIQKHVNKFDQDLADFILSKP